MRARLKHLLPIALALGSNASMAFDYVVVKDAATMYRGHFDGHTEIVDLSPALPALPSCVRVAPGGGYLAATVGNDLYRIGGSLGDTELEATLPFTPTDMQVVDGMYLFLSPLGITDLSGAIIVTTALLPPAASMFDVVEEAPGAFFTVVAGGSELRAIRFTIAGDTTLVATSDVSIPIRDLALGEINQSLVVAYVVSNGDLREKWAQWLEDKPGSLPSFSRVEWPACDPMKCRPVGHKQNDEIVIVEDDWTVTPVATVPAGTLGATRGATALQPAVAAGNDGTGAGTPPEAKYLFPSFGSLLPGGGGGTGLRVAVGDVVSTDSADPAGDGVIDLTVGYYSYYGSNTTRPMVRTYQRTGSSWLSGPSWDPYGDGRFGATVATTRLYPSSDVNPPDEVLTGPGPGPVFGPHVRAFTYAGAPLAKVNLFAYGTLKYGVNVAACNNALKSDWTFITGAGPGTVFGPHVRGWTTNVPGMAQPIQKINFFAYPSGYVYGAEVAWGDIGDGDGYNEILVGPGGPQGANPNLPTFTAEIRAFNYDNTQVQVIDLLPQDPATSSYFLPAGASNQQAYGGARVAFMERRLTTQTYTVAGAHGPDPNVADPKVDYFTLADTLTGNRREFSGTSLCSSCGLFVGATQDDGI